MPRALFLRRLPGPCLSLFALAVLGFLLPVADTAAQGNVRLSADDRAIYAKAFEMFDKGQPEDSLRQAAQASNGLPYKAMQWLYYTEPRSSARFEDIVFFLKGNPHWPGQRLLQRRAEEALDKDYDDATLLRWFDANAPISVDGAMLYARAMLRAGRRGEAEELIREFWIAGGFGRAQEREVLKQFGQLLRPEDHLARLDRLLWDRQAVAAQRVLNKVPRSFRSLADARIRLARRRGGVDAAIDRVPASLKDDPGLLFERMRWRRRAGLYEGALEILSNPPRNLVRPERWWQERNYLTREALQRGDISLAYRIARDHRLSEGVEFATSEFLAGWIATRFLSEHPMAYRHFTRLYRGVGYPISLSRGAYWAGRAAESAGDRRLARGWYETAAQFVTAYYGQLAAARLGAWDKLRVQNAPEPSAAERQAFRHQEMVALVELLTTLNQAEKIDPFFNGMFANLKSPSDYVLLARLGEWAGRADLGLRVAKKAALSGVTMLEHSYPLTRLPKLDKAPEPALILALIRQESAYNVKAVSSAGARGMMQLMPGTAKLVAKQEGLRYSRSRLTEDPDYNIRLGSAYLHGLLERFDGSYVLALAGYNAGPGRVEQWIREYGNPRDPKIDAVDWVEMIPFSETRNYVQRILESLQIYRHRLRGSTLALHLDRDLQR